MFKKIQYKGVFCGNVNIIALLYIVSVEQLPGRASYVGTSVPLCLQLPDQLKLFQFSELVAFITCPPKRIFYHRTLEFSTTEHN